MRTSQRVRLHVAFMAFALCFVLCDHVSAAPPVVDAYSRFRDGPVFLTASVIPTFHNVTTLDVTPGLYVIFAKGFVATHGIVGGTKLDCRLVAGADSDRIRVGVDSRNDFRTDEEAFSLNVLHNFSSAGTIVLKCACDADDADLSFLKITAVRVKSYWNLPQ